MSAVAWLILAGIALVLELGSGAIAAVYVALGALVAAIVAAGGGPAWLQLAAFAVSAVAGLVFTRRLVVRHLQRPGDGRKEIGLTDVIGRRGVVTREVSPGTTGLVRVGGETWSAAPYADVGPPLPVGTEVEVLDLEGLVVHVARADDHHLDGMSGGDAPRLDS